jgi:hypothetical protein
MLFAKRPSTQGVPSRLPLTEEPARTSELGEPSDAPQCVTWLGAAADRRPDTGIASLAESGAGWETIPVAFGTNPMQTGRTFRTARSRPPVYLAGATGCGDYRLWPATCGDSRPIPVRDVRGMKRSRRSFTPGPATKHADLQVLYGSDGTRTRDLRRDRPVRRNRLRPATTRIYRLEQPFPRRANRL